MKETTKSKILQEMVRDFHLVHGPGRHSLFLRPGHDLRSSFLPEKAVSEKRFVAVLGEIHLHSWSFIIVRHGGHVHRDVFCFLFTRFAVTHSSSNSPVDFCKVLQYAKLFLVSPTFQVPTPYSTTYSGYALVRSKITKSCCVVFGSFVWRTRVDELPQDCFVV